MILEDGFVIVEEGKLWVGLYVETVGRPGVLHIVDSSGNQYRQYLKDGHPLLVTMMIT